MDQRELRIRKFVRKTLLEGMSGATEWMNQQWNTLDDKDYLVTGAMRKFGLSKEEAESVYGRIQGKKGKLGELRRVVRRKLKELMQLGVPNFNAMDDDDIPVNSKEDFRKVNQENAPKKAPPVSLNQLKETNLTVGQKVTVNGGFPGKVIEIGKDQLEGMVTVRVYRQDGRVNGDVTVPNADVQVVSEHQKLRESIETYKMPDGNIVLAKNGQPMRFANFAQVKKWVDFLAQKGIEAFSPAKYSRAKYVVIRNPEKLNEDELPALVAGGGSIFSYLKPGEKFVFNKSDKEKYGVYTKISSRSYKDSRGTTYQSSPRTAVFRANESLKEGGTGRLGGDASDVLDGIVVGNKGKDNKTLLKILKSKLSPSELNGASDEELLDYIDDTKRMYKIKENFKPNAPTFVQYVEKKTGKDYDTVLANNNLIDKLFDEYNKKFKLQERKSNFERATGTKKKEMCEKHQMALDECPCGRKNIKEDAEKPWKTKRIEKRPITNPWTGKVSQKPVEVGEGVEKRGAGKAEDFVRAEMLKPMSQRTMSEEELVSALQKKFGMNQRQAENLVDKYASPYTGARYAHKNEAAVDYYDLKVGKRVNTKSGPGTIIHVHSGALDGAVEIKLDSGKTITVQGHKLSSIDEAEQPCSQCGGNGVVSSPTATGYPEKCDKCKGTGKIQLTPFRTLTKEAREWLRKKSLNEEWKGWKPNMPVQIVGVSGGEVTPDGHGVQVFTDLASAKHSFPDLDPERNTKRFTWAMKGSVSGKEAIRFETWKAEDIYSR